MAKYFGTDGFRGRANEGLYARQAYKIGRFLGWHYGSARVLIGKDTRKSGYMLEYALASGLCSSGADAYLLHVTTTPSVSFLTKEQGFDLGIMITASHNPYTDNGIKILDKNGEKLSEDVLLQIESYLDSENDDLPLAMGEKIGIVHDYGVGREKYINQLTSYGLPLNGYKIGLDMANGAGYDIARKVFLALGATIFEIGSTPNGLNINRDCGSTHIETLCSLVKKEGLDFGFAFDGDADRCIAVNEKGEVVDGDKLIYALANALKEKNELRENTVALTVMSNSGIIKSLGDIGIDTVVTPVGDKYVSEKMNELSLSLGGEQSGHIIVKKYSNTGDGILSAILIANEIKRQGLSLSRLCEDAKAYPQKTKSVRVKNKEKTLKNRHVTEAFLAIEAKINGNGRALLRASGTEEVIRIMVECESEQKCSEYINYLEIAVSEADKNEN